MKNFKRFILFTVPIILVISSCGTFSKINLYCQNDDIEMYIDDIYIGKSLVEYIVPKGQKVVKVVYKKDGVVVSERYFEVRNNQLYEAHIDEQMSYSSGLLYKSK